MSELKVYLVGGAVRDKLLGKEPKDHDYVVVGGSYSKMHKLGYKHVGNNFPVFLHPKTGEEYALARIERKKGKGYNGFRCDTRDVTLEDDLKRRDLTINAMAMDENGILIDPYGGQLDLEDGILRHVSEAFAEDPLRVLRVARFAARYDFDVAPATMNLMQQMVKSGELSYLTPERVSLEIMKAMGEQHPWQFIMVLLNTGALKVVLPEVEVLAGVPQPIEHHPERCTFRHTMMALYQCTLLTDDPVVRFATLVHDLGKGVTPVEELPHHYEHEKRGVAIIEALCDRLKFPNVYKQAGMEASEHHTRVHTLFETQRPGKVLKLLTKLAAPHTLERVKRLALVAEADARGRLGLEDRAYPQGPAFVELGRSLAGFNIKDVVAEAQTRGKKGPELGEAIEQARCHFMKREMRRVRNLCLLSRTRVMI